MSWVTFALILVTATTQLVSLHANVNDSSNSTEDRPYWWTAKLKRVAEFKSSVGRDNVTVTAVAPLSLDRLLPLMFQCQLHQGCSTVAFAGAVYLPLFENKILTSSSSEFNGLAVPEAVARVQKFHEEAVEKGCILDLVLWQEELPEVSDWFTYPNNALRNKALELAQTEVVALIDADFVIGPISFGEFLQPGQALYESTLEVLNNKSMVVMPAFDCTLMHNQTEEVDRAMRQAVVRKCDLLSNEHIEPFQSYYHENSDYKRWQCSTTLYSIPYLLEGRNHIYGYEPYVLALKRGLPCYDERFRGYFFNKVAFFYHAFRLGYNFVVHPEAYVIHYPHERLDNIKLGWEGPRRQTLQKLIERMSDEFTAGTYRPYVEDSSCGSAFQ